MTLVAALVSEASRDVKQRPSHQGPAGDWNRLTMSRKCDQPTV